MLDIILSSLQNCFSIDSAFFCVSLLLLLHTTNRFLIGRRGNILPFLFFSIMAKKDYTVVHKDESRRRVVRTKFNGREAMTNATYKMLYICFEGEHLMKKVPCTSAETDVLMRAYTTNVTSTLIFSHLDLVTHRFLHGVPSGKEAETIEAVRSLRDKIDKAELVTEIDSSSSCGDYIVLATSFTT